jgi:S1-C subfamily serine protease
MIEKLQLKDENETSVPNSFSSILISDKNEDTKYDKENDDNENNESIERPNVWLGIEGFDFDPVLAEEMRVSEDLEGIVIQSVVSNSPAYNAGLKDLVLDVDN